MKSLLEMDKEIKAAEEGLEKNQRDLQDVSLRKMILLSNREAIERDLYQKRIYRTHIREIFRLAKIQFSRFRNLPEPTLTVADVRELDKWIGRAKGEDGLIDIINALLELEKYRASEIKTNLYALAQKIIIGGAYNQKKRS